MSEVIAQLSVSLDGYLTGPDAGREHPLGIGGERLHQWVFGLRSWRGQQGIKGGTGGPEDDLVAEWIRRLGAVVMGHGMFTSGEEPWGENPPFRMPVYVVTHHPREPLVKEGGTVFHFITEGPERALALAREAAGDKDVSLAGGADLVQQFIRAGLLDELLLHVVPVLTGEGGRRLFDNVGDKQLEWRKTQVLDAPDATHIRLRAR
ncbi:dihydrofolate reductase family protein [Streptomyces sp. AS02]|uniref:dihydrofolate reductase family protein n=1 Tax=Streptomyces sp. AS02 TaxID=2938946 RepID=UPI002021B5F0|nr:dihydrofolate reductase family protein [Streptomyces sp. AS02]MCL8010257.1 dihydrofolate reductase family protein [Streptomyces sp. AS02]